MSLTICSCPSSMRGLEASRRRDGVRALLHYDARIGPFTMLDPGCSPSREQAE